MQFRAMLRKEIKVLFRNRLLIFANVFLPILIIAINLLYSSSATIDIVIGIWGQDELEQEIISLMDSYSEDISFSYYMFADEKEAFEAYRSKNISYIVHNIGDGKYDISYKNGEQKSEIAHQYFIAALRDINAGNYTPEMIASIMNAQKYIVQSIIPIEEEKVSDLNGYIWTGFIWIFVYSNLSLAITQMQQERATKTLLYICKVGTRWNHIFLSKMIAGLVQFFMILVSFILATSCLKQLDYHFYWLQIPLWMLVVVCIFAIGHFLGTVIKNSAFLVIIQMLMVFPLMLMNTLQTSGLDMVMKHTPVYCAIQVAKCAMLGQKPLLSDGIVCIATIVLCYLITGVYLSKQEPIKICRLQ